MSETESERAQGGAYPSDYENQRTPEKDGEPPRPATEPKGAEGSSDSGGTFTEPGTGAAHDDAERAPGSAG